LGGSDGAPVVVSSTGLGGARVTTGLRGRGGAARGLGAVILSQLLLRVGSAAGALVVGSYFVELRSRGVPVTAFVLGVLSGLTYVTELVFAPAAGASSDRRGRRAFLVVAPVLAAVGVLLTPGASVVTAVPPLTFVVAVVAVARLVEARVRRWRCRRRWGCWRMRPTATGCGGGGR
jgi:MFS family permease